MYDQFGRLFLGSEDVARDVLEFVIFERFLSFEYGAWRMHAKILLPESTPPPVVLKTYNTDKFKTAQKNFKYASADAKDEEEEGEKTKSEKEAKA